MADGIVTRRICLHCGAEFLAYSPPCRPRNYCSTACGRLSRLGTKQSADHVAKRKRFGAEHPNWKGDEACEKAGRTRALRAFPSPGKCENCASEVRIDRHHVDGNTLNNSPENVRFLCRTCHMTADGRITKMAEVRRGQR